MDFEHSDSYMNELINNMGVRLDALEDLNSEIL